MTELKDDAENPAIDRSQRWRETSRKAGSYLRTRWLYFAVGAASALLGLVVGLVVQPPVTQSDEYVALQSEFDDARDEVDEYQQTVSSLQSDLGTMERREESVETRAQGLDVREEDLDSREAGLVEREEAVGIAEAEKEANTIYGGTSIVGTDVQPGRYRSNGGDLCYWERLRGLSGEFGDIIANGISEGPVVVEIQSSDVAFKSQGCGSWTRI